MLVLAFFRRAQLSCQDILLCPSVHNVCLHKQSRDLSFGPAKLGLNTYSWIFPWYFANGLCHLSSKFPLVSNYTSDSKVISQTFHMTYFIWFSPLFLKTSLECSGVLPKVSVHSSLIFSSFLTQTLDSPGLALVLSPKFEMGTWLLTGENKVFPNFIQIVYCFWTKFQWGI